MRKANVIDRAAVRLAEFIKANNPQSASVEVLTYSSIIAINTILALLISLIACIITGNTTNFFIVVVVFTLLRFLTGGVHLTSSLTCCIATIVCFLAIIHLKFDFFYLGLVLNAFSLYIFILRAPSGIDEIREVKPAYKLAIKIAASLFVFSNFFIQSSLLASVFFVQALSLTTTCAKLIKKFEGGLFNESENDFGSRS